MVNEKERGERACWAAAGRAFQKLDKKFDLMGGWLKLGRPKIRAPEMLKYDVNREGEFGVNRSSVRELGLPINFGDLISGLNIGPIGVREENWVEDIKWAFSSGMESFASGLPQMGCSRKCVMFDDVGKSFSTRLTWKATKRLKAAPFIENGSEGMPVVSLRVYQLLNILEFNFSDDERWRRENFVTK